MGWNNTTLTEEMLVSQRNASESYYVFNTSGQSKHRDRTFVTTVVEHRNMTQALAQASAAAMDSDTMDGSYNRTVVTADVQRQNDAGAYKIVKTTAYTSAWSAFTEFA